MAIVGALSTGRSGLINSGAALGVIGNNIANVSTTGFKGSRTEFADLLSAEGGGEVGKIGLGSRIQKVRTNYSQGAVESTGRSLDMALDGQGFFVLQEGQGTVFSRAGNFQLTPEGILTNAIELPVMGYPVTQDGQIAGGLQPINVGGINSPPSPTSTVDLTGNVQSDLDYVGSGATLGVFDPTSFDTAFDTANFSTTIQVYDSLGQQHTLNVFFTKQVPGAGPPVVAPNTWEVNFGVDGGDVGGTAGALAILGAPTDMVFDSSGNVTSPAGGTISVSANFNGAATGQTMTVNLSDMTQYSSPSGITYVTQNGYGSGGLTSLGVDSAGVISATFDNGQTRPLYQLAIARFAAPEGLRPAGNQIYRDTVNSGPPAIAFAQSSGNGNVIGSALEQSNVQIAQEFIDLISQQRSFQANARVISASDSLLGDLINIVR